MQNNKVSHAILAVLVLCVLYLAYRGHQNDSIRRSNSPPANLTVRVHELRVSERWLTWNQSIFPTEIITDDFLISTFAVFDLMERKPLSVTDHNGTIEWLADDMLYIARNKRSFNTPDLDLIQIDLNTLQESIVQRNIPAWPVVNGESAFWIEFNPSGCNCEEGCSHDIVELDLESGSREIRQKVSSRDWLLGWAQNYLMLQAHHNSGCDIKAFSGPIELLDLANGETYAFNAGVVSWRSDVFAAITSEFIAFSSDYSRLRVYRLAKDRSPVLTIERNGWAQGFAASEFVLFTPIPFGQFWPKRGLSALNLNTGQNSILNQSDYVREASGNSQVAAWITEEDQIYAVPLENNPDDQLTFRIFPN